MDSDEPELVDFSHGDQERVEDGGVDDVERDCLKDFLELGVRLTTGCGPGAAAQESGEQLGLERYADVVEAVFRRNKDGDSEIVEA